VYHGNEAAKIFKQSNKRVTVINKPEPSYRWSLLSQFLLPAFLFVHQ